MRDGMARVTLKQAQAAKQAVLRRFEGVCKIVGVGITRVDGEYAVKVNLEEAAGPGVRLPTEIEGVRVRVDVIGPIRAR